MVAALFERIRHLFRFHPLCVQYFKITLFSIIQQWSDFVYKSAIVTLDLPRKSHIMQRPHEVNSTVRPGQQRKEIRVMFYRPGNPKIILLEKNFTLEKEVGPDPDNRSRLRQDSAFFLRTRCQAKFLTNYCLSYERQRFIVSCDLANNRKNAK